MNVLAFVVSGLMTGALAPAVAGQTRTSPDFRCFPSAVQDEIMTCGCTLKIAGRSCGPDHDTGLEAHFYSELHDGAPLFVDLGGRVVSLPSRRPQTNTFSFGKGDRWSEEYTGEDFSVRILYRPAKSTCPKSKIAEGGCEYFDVAADIVVTRPAHPPVKYRAIGSCGC